MTRISLASLESNDRKIEFAGDDDIELPEYSAFKYGDGLVARKYAQELAQRIQYQLGARDIVLTSSGFGFAPPAAHQLAVQVGEILAAPVVKVHRSNVSNGDYASMSVEERKANMQGSGLEVLGDVTGRTVVAIDDIRVTGVHEELLERTILDAGASIVHHAYVLDAYAAKDDPLIESVVNSSGIRTSEELLALACSPDFVPNARFVKRVVNMVGYKRRRFFWALPAEVQQWVVDTIFRDKLYEVEAYCEGSVALVNDVLGAR